MDIQLDAIETRVLGCLAEKELATPEYYPLTLNALTSACNQKSNRSPVMNLDDSQVQAALDTLRKKQLAMLSTEGVRTTRYAHNLRGPLHLQDDELAILAELLIRGPQTVGELRTRAERMHPIADLQAVSSILEELSERTPPLVEQLPRQPGHKESRFRQLLSLHDEVTPDHEASSAPAQASDLHGEIERLREELASLRSEFEAFRSQFE